ncbi:MAG: ABC transporter permease [Clostridia bacterium]|nr:ABC transporter permease [Clostridia bacterium]
MKDALTGKDRFARVLYAVAPVISIGIFVLIWMLMHNAKPRLVASPIDVVERCIALCQRPISGQYLWGHMFASIRRILIALALAIIVGVPLGILIGWNPYVRGTLGTIFELIRPIPALAWIPLFVMWMGIAETPKIVMVFMGSLMPIVVNSYTGVRLVSPLYLNVGKMFNCTKGSQLLTHIVVPAALPAIFAGIRGATSIAWMVVLAAEMLGADSGLGFLINRGMSVFDISLIMTGMTMIGILGALLAVLTNFIERKVCPWNTSLKTSD